MKSIEIFKEFLKKLKGENDKRRNRAKDEEGEDSVIQKKSFKNIPMVLENPGKS